MTVDPITMVAAGKIASDAVSSAKTAAELGESIDRYRLIFKKYKPDITNIRINYQDCEALIDLHISLKDKNDWRAKIEIPYGPDFTIVNTYAGLYKPVRNAWKISNGKYILNGKDIPKDCDDLLVSLKGKIDKNILDKFIEITRSTDPFDNGEEDRYWMCSKITNATVLEKLYDGFILENVNVDVHVIVRSSFTTSISPDLKIIMSAGSQLINAEKSGDRNQQKIAKYRLKKLKDWAPVEPHEIYKVVADLIARRNFKDYVYTKGSYSIGQIYQDEDRVTPIPDTVEVDAFTDLNFENDFAEGHIFFKREDYKKEIRDEMDKLLDKKIKKSKKRRK